VPKSPQPNAVISTEGGALCRRSGKTPVLAVVVALALIFFLSIPAGNLLLLLPLRISSGLQAAEPPPKQTGFSPGLSSTHPNTSRRQQTEGPGW